MIHIKNSLNPKHINQLAEAFKALASPARVAIVLALAEQEMSVNELVDMLSRLDCACSCERTNISKHLAVLRDAGIVSCIEEAQRRLYRLDTPCLLQAISCTVQIASESSSGKNGEVSWK
jgi:DNA-binding transcriptional ArsR family regulator